MTIKMKILLLDNYDSFTYNLLHAVKELGATDVEVVRNDQIELDEVDRFDKIILSPGPGIPEEAGLLLPIIKRYAPTKSILGVCLGHQPSAKLSEHVWKISKKYIMGYRLRLPSFTRICFLKGWEKKSLLEDTIPGYQPGRFSRLPGNNGRKSGRTNHGNPP